ncbi:MAG: CoA transferase [Acidimicrobiaceae bacterium]|nr:CoA transferase [Acidimicrobiaceae bacterium]
MQLSDRSESSERPLEGVNVVEVALGISAVGAGMAASLPGAMLRDLGANVCRVQSTRRSSLDSGVEFERVWNRGKETVEVDDEQAPDAVRSLTGDADVVFLSGSELAVERSGIGAQHLGRSNRRLIAVRIRPSFNALGSVPDLELLVAARAGVPTQLRGPEPGRPTFPDLAVCQVGAGLSATVAALAGLYERESTGVGRWAETSLYDGIPAILPMIIGRVEHHSPSTRLLWERQGPDESLCYRCGDGKYVQLWFGAKGAYDAFLEHIGDPPSVEGYNADMMSGALVERGERWAAKFATRDRAWWLEHLAGQKFRCEPVLLPGEALGETHVKQMGLAVDLDDADLGPLTVLGPQIQVVPSAGSGVTGPGSPPASPAGPLLSGVRVLDLSAYLAGPVAPLVLAELGADVVKVEPVTGDVHRNMEPMFAAGQRGKRSVALDLKSPEAAAVLERLFRWADLVHHNSRVGLAEQLGYDEATVRSANPAVIYCFASGFGENGPWSRLPANDQLVQALSGVEGAQAGPGQPRFLTWGAIDTAGGWVSACGLIAALYARRRTGLGQRVSTSLLGAGLTFKSGAFVAGGTPVSGPVIDSRQYGYGAAYRIYPGGDGAWFALAVPDAEAWSRLRALVQEVADVEGLPEAPPPLRMSGHDPQPEELLLEQAFGRRPASAWVEELQSQQVPAELVANSDRCAFVDALVDDPVNRQLHRVVTYHWGERGEVDQPRFPPRFGPEAIPGAGASMPGLGEHSASVLEGLGFDSEARAKLAAAGVIPSA